MVRVVSGMFACQTQKNKTHPIYLYYTYNIHCENPQKRYGDDKYDVFCSLLSGVLLIRSPPHPLMAETANVFTVLCYRKMSAMVCGIRYI